MIPIKTSVEDLQTLVDYTTKQVGWTPISKLKSALAAAGVADDRKIATAVNLGFIDRDDSQVRSTQLGAQFSRGEAVEALRSAIKSHSLYWPTIEWMHYGSATEVSTVDIANYWESQLKTEVGDVSGQTLKDGATVFARVASGADLGRFFVGRGGKETRIELDRESLKSYYTEEPATQVAPDTEAGVIETSRMRQDSELHQTQVQPATQSPRVSVSTQPNIHVNVEIHIAADATAETVQEIFKNMARYVLNHPTTELDG